MAFGNEFLIGELYGADSRNNNFKMIPLKIISEEIKVEKNIRITDNCVILKPLKT